MQSRTKYRLLAALATAPCAASSLASAQEAPVVPALVALPRDLSPWAMFVDADVVVKTAMICLALASLTTWTVWLAKGVEIAAAKRWARGATALIRGAESLNDARRILEERRVRRGAVLNLMKAALSETDRSSGLSAEGAKERLAIAFSRIEANAGRRMARGTGLLATIGATAPFVGLFGTVWGIMNSFVGISQAHTTNLAVVAPGIAQALLATAIGLVAAIPAVIIYNVFARSIAGYRALIADASAEILQRVSRDLERGETARGDDAASHAHGASLHLAARARPAE